MTTVVWLKARTLCWDQHLVDGLLSSPEFVHQEDEVDPGGCVLVVPARYFEPAEIQTLIDPLPWVLVILTSDEESTFDHEVLTHPAMRLWVMTPRPGQHAPGSRHLPEGCPADTTMALADRSPLDRPLDVFFAGQVTHERREACVAGMQALPESLRVEILPTEGFTEGIDRHDYLAVLASTKIAPCPSGPATPDSFRLFEALEAGCLPIADALAPAEGYLPGYWPLLFNEAPPFPVIEDWAELPKEVDAALSAWPGNAIRAQAWWLLRKRAYRLALAADVAELSGTEADTGRITVLVSTSPIPSHPSTAVLEQTLDTVRERLPHAEIIVMADGVHPDQEHRRSAYEDFLRQMVWKCAHEWDNVVPLVAEHHAHQANMTRAALELVATPLVLFVEHDTPLCEDIPFDALADVIESGQANLIRLHHEAHVLEPHQHLMLDREPQIIDGVPLLRTVQWSQRPHLASAGFYRSIITTYFGSESRTMIEDVMHGVLDAAWRIHRLAGWQQFRTWMYAPAGDMKRSLHLDGRGEDAKVDMVFAYDGPTPQGAPTP